MMPLQLPPSDGVLAAAAPLAALDRPQTPWLTARHAPGARFKDNLVALFQRRVLEVLTAACC